MCYTRHCGLKMSHLFPWTLAMKLCIPPSFILWISAVAFKGLFLTSVKLGGSEPEFRSEGKWPKWKGVGADFMWWGGRAGLARPKMWVGKSGLNDQGITPVSAALKLALVMNLEIKLFIPTYKTSGDRELERVQRTAFVLPLLMNILISYEGFYLILWAVSYIMWKVLHYMCFCSQSCGWESRKSDLSVSCGEPWFCGVVGQRQALHTPQSCMWDQRGLFFRAFSHRESRTPSPNSSLVWL